MISIAEKPYINNAAELKYRRNFYSSKPAFSANPAVEALEFAQRKLRPRDYVYILLKKTVLRTEKSREFLGDIWDRLPRLAKFSTEKIREVDPDKVLRGPTPPLNKMYELARRNIKAMINFQILPPEKIQKLQNRADDLGIEFINIPINSSRGATKAQLAKFDAETARLRKTLKKGEFMYFCCRHGTERTGRFSARYKIRYKNTKPHDALEEMRDIGYRERLFPVLGQQVLSDKLL